MAKRFIQAIELTAAAVLLVYVLSPDLIPSNSMAIVESLSCARFESNREVFLTINLLDIGKSDQRRIRINVVTNQVDDSRQNLWKTSPLGAIDVPWDKLRPGDRIAIKHTRSRIESQVIAPETTSVELSERKSICSFAHNPMQSGERN